MSLCGRKRYVYREITIVCEGEPVRFISLFAVAVLLIVFLLCAGDDHLLGAAASSGIHDAIRSGDLARVKALLERYPRLISDIDGSTDPTLLHEAALSGNCDIVRFLLSKGMSVKCGDICERTPLHMAAQAGHYEAARILIENGADVNAIDLGQFKPDISARGKGETELLITPEKYDGTAPLHLAAENGHSDIITLLLENGAKLALKDERGMSPFLRAASHGQTEALKLLASRGAYVKQIQMEQSCALDLACEGGHTETVKFLIACGARPNGHSLHLAALSGNLPLVSLLLEKGADLRGDYGQFALCDAILVKNNEMVKFFLSRGVSAEAPFAEEKVTPLHIASGWRGVSYPWGDLSSTFPFPSLGDTTDNEAFNETEIVKTLLSQGAKVSVCTVTGETPLHCAADKGLLQIVKLLVSKGAFIDSSNIAKETPLFRAAHSGNREIAEFLISKGADPDAEEIGGSTPRQLLQESDPEMQKALPLLEKMIAEGKTLEAGELIRRSAGLVNGRDASGDTPLHVAVRYNKLDIAAMLIEKGAGLEARDNNGRTPLLNALNCISERPEIAMLLIDKGANPNARDKITGNTPLQNAISNRNESLAELLITKGAKVNGAPGSEYSPLEIAAAQALRNTVELLLKKGASVNPRAHGLTPLHCAKSPEVIRMLLQAKADINSRTDTGETPLSMASRDGDVEKVRMLLSAGADATIRDKKS